MPLPLWVLWMIFSIILIIVEIITPEFIVASFALGGFIAAVVAVFSNSIALQLFAFSLATIIFLWKIRPIFLKYLDNNSEDSQSNVYSLIGKNAKVIKKIGPDENKGRVKIGGEDWMAMSEKGKKIEEGTSVTIIKVEGAKVIVKEK